MANELNFYGDLTQTGLTVVARVYDSSGVQEGGDVDCFETGSLAIYVGNMPSLAAGQYGVRFFSGSTLLSQGVINWDGTQEYDLIGAADVSSLATAAAVAAIPTTDNVADLAPVLNAIAALNDLSVADVEGSNLAKEASLTALATAVGLIPTTDNVADIAPVLTAISGLNDVTPAEVRAAFNDADFQDKNTEAEIHAWLDTYANKDNWKATATTVDLTPVLNAISGLNDPTAQQIYDLFTTGTNEDAFKADTSGLSVDLTPVTTAIAALNDISVADIEASSVLAKEATLTALAAAVALIPTDVGTVDLTPVLNAISALNDVTAAEVRVAFNAADFQDKNTEAEVHAWLNSYANKDDWKADVTSVPTAAENADELLNRTICN